MRRKNREVILQFEGFCGTLSEDKVSHLVVNQSICNLPPYPINHVIRICYNGSWIGGFVEISPTGDNIKIFLNMAGDGNAACRGDQIIVPGCAIGWISKE